MMRRNLPPPHWSPTGNSGTWTWDEQAEKNPRTDEVRGAWTWADDEIAKPPRQNNKKKSLREKYFTNVLDIFPKW